MQKLIKIKKNTGMTYVELIVVLSIFAVLSSVVVFNYGDFQARVDIKNLASDIALKIVEAQKSSLNGLLPTQGGYIVNSKPSYGVYFFNPVSDGKNFIYFTDLNNDTLYLDGSSCAGECLNKINITKNNYISRIDKCSSNPCVPSTINNPLAIIFSRPGSGAVFTGAIVNGSDYIQITIASPKGATALIKIYLSGRVQVN